MTKAPQPWYHKGLRFTCKRCGGCCRGEPGYVWVTLSDIDRMAAELAMSAEEFFQRYVRVVEGAYSLKERSNGDCVLFAEKVGCRAYSSRPIQCRTFPFWPEYVNTPAGWERAARRCPAVNCGELLAADEISRHLKAMNESGW